MSHRWSRVVPLVAVLAPSLLFAQVRIRERVEISPHQKPAAPTSVASPGTIRFDFSFSGSLQPGWPHNFFAAKNPCITGGLVLLSGGSASLSSPALSVEYNYGATIWTFPGGSVTLSAYLDGELIQQNSIPVACKCRMYLPFWVTLFDNFDLAAGNNRIAHGESNTFQLSGTILNLCSPTVWHPEVQTTLTITSGSELGQFVDQSGQPLGSSVTRKGSELSRVRFAADGEQPRDPEGTVVVEASSRGITKTVTFTVSRTAPLVDHFAIILEHDEIAFTETSKIFVQAKDANDQNVDFDDNELLFFTVIENGQYGTFIKKNGDTVKTEPPTLGDISYADARTGRMQFAAVRQLAKIRVAWQGDETKKGEREIAVLEQTLKIVMIGPQEVRPLIPEEIIRLPGDQGSIIPSRAMTELRVQLTRGGVRIADHPFTLSSDYIDGSGGHDHLTDRRPRTLDNYGYFALKQATPTQASNPFAGTTRAGEEGSIIYTASVFGDRMLFEAKSTRSTFLWDTLSIVERVQGLVPLPTGADNLITYTSTERCHALANSNYGRPDVVEAISRAVRSYAEEYGLADDIFLTAIDMSLPLGGGFDVQGGWDRDISGERGAAGHQFHRVGKSIDLSHTYRDAFGETITVNIYLDGILQETTDTVDDDTLDRIFNKRGFSRWERRINKIHYESRN